MIFYKTRKTKTMLLIPQSDVDAYLEMVIGHVANQLNVLQSHQCISASYPTVGKKLENFINAYNDWYQFHVNLDKSGVTTLSSQQDQALKSLIQSRDFTRTDLIAEISKILSTLVSKQLFESPYDENELEHRWSTKHDFKQ